jgi:hypothetical protein
MGKGSGTCARPGISLAVTDGTETDSTLSGEVAGVNTAIKMQVIKHHWFTMDGKVSFKETNAGWEAFPGPFSNPIREAFHEYGIIDYDVQTSLYQSTPFSSLQEARQAVNDVSLEAGLGIDSSLTRQRHISYNVGDLPLSIRKEQNYWLVALKSTLALSASLQDHFNSVEEFNATWLAANISTVYPTRKGAHQAVTNWLAQTIAKGK